MTLKKGDIANFETLKRAAASGQLALVESRLAATGEYVALICGLSHVGEMVYPAPFGIMNRGNPYEDYLDPTTSTLPPATKEPNKIDISVKPMKLSSGDVDYFVSIKMGRREITPYVFRNEQFKAEYEAESFRWLLLGHDKPDLMKYEPDNWPGKL